MKAILETLLQSPKLGLYVRQMQEALREEEVRRRSFYEQVAEDDKAEFINGTVVFQSPAKFRHTLVVQRTTILLDTHVTQRRLGAVGSEKCLVTLSRNDYEPDVCFWANPRAAAFTPDQMQFPAPDLVVEVLSPSTEATDRGVKFEDYAAHGVGEYWVIDPETEVVEQYALRGDAYHLHLKLNGGQIQSLVVAGFAVPVRAIFDDGEKTAALRQLLQPARP